ncbi:uncharacterized protein TRAVEDRAFT_55393 [Trametes versicolor FP-101664 SS1]|uniref:uncharacterized protein n=1 Tax=Trametes versicolor (strain FP-101664) TaxID=717944 RepID=UPI0004623546|nr:uncharacterized protein TRAVEDRAFT_55393 [Trametes versicolor FP-101664 SS1]EIW64479.1 hypothetical protein TRAVEDRAFT_55393 [Trametes versicolor FP-101664 SS1]
MKRHHARTNARRSRGTLQTAPFGVQFGPRVFATSLSKGSRSTSVTSGDARNARPTDGCDAVPSIPRRLRTHDRAFSAAQRLSLRAEREPNWWPARTVCPLRMAAA